MIPSIVRKLRPLLERIVFTAIFIYSRIAPILNACSYIKRYLTHITLYILIRNVYAVIYAAAFVFVRISVRLLVITAVLIFVVFIVLIALVILILAILVVLVFFYADFPLEN